LVCTFYIIILNITISENCYSYCVVAPAGATKEGDEIVILPSAAKDLGGQATCTDTVLGQTNSIPYVNPVPGVTDQSSNINPPSPENEQTQDLSLGAVVNLPSPSKDSSNNRYSISHACPLVPHLILL
jgi:hypothetical protein